MIKLIRRFLGIESLEEASTEYASLLESSSMLKSELDVMAKEYTSTNHRFDIYSDQEKSEESLELMKSERDQFTSRYLQCLAEKKGEFDKIESDKDSLLKKYPDLEKAVVEFSKIQVVDKLLKSYREGKIDLQDSNLLIKAVTKKKVKFSDNIVFNQDGEILILERADGEGDDRKITWALPGGHVEEGEAHRGAAIRELLEETGYTVDDCYLVGEYDDKNVCIEYYTSMVNTDDQTATLQADEVQYYEFIPIEKLYEYTPFHPNMWDNVYEILGIKREIVKIRKAIEEGYVKKDIIDEDISKGGKTSKKKFNKVMKEYGEGTLHSGGDGKTVKDHKQALAIAFSEEEESKKAIEDNLEKSFEDEFEKSLQIISELFDEDTSLQINEILKSKTGIYKDNPENRKAGRVGRKYGKQKEDLESKKKIRITSDLAGGQGNTTAFHKDDEIEVIKIDSKGAIVWAESLSGKRKVLIPHHQYEIVDKVDSSKFDKIQSNVAENFSSDFDSASEMETSLKKRYEQGLKKEGLSMSDLTDKQKKQVNEHIKDEVNIFKESNVDKVDDLKATLKDWDISKLSKKSDGKIDWKMVREEIWSDYTSTNIPAEHRKPEFARKLYDTLRKKYKDE